MAVLVTGGAGYIGSHVTWALLEAGEDVVVIDRFSTGFSWAVAPAAQLYGGDIADTVLLDEIISRHRIDAIIHLAGSVVVPESVSAPLAYYENNTLRSHALISKAVEAGIRYFVFSSTAAVYGMQDSNEAIAENAPLRPESPYGRSKLLTEMMLRDTSAAHPFVYTALRYFNVAGADSELRAGQCTAGATHLLKVACETALGKRDKITVFGTDYPTFDGTCVRDYIHVSDLAAAHVLALKRMRRGGGSLVANCGYGSGYSVLEVLECVRACVGRDFEVELGPRRPGDAGFVVANPSLARKELGWLPRYEELDTMVRTALAWEARLNTFSKIAQPSQIRGDQGYRDAAAAVRIPGPVPHPVHSCPLPAVGAR
nr:UDP-glucose 4-epimerase GalE [Rhizobium sp. Q54]